MPDQLLMYDTALANWLTTQFGTLVADKTFNLMVGTPDRAFAEYHTPTRLAPDGRPPLPRAAITIEDPEEDPERFNPNTIRKLGWTSDGQGLKRANYPTPVRLPYTLNFWSEYKREMNLYMQQILQLFRFQYIYIPVDIDSIAPEPLFGTKDIGIFIDSAINNTGDLEPGNKERIMRRTVNIHMKAWLWDFGTLVDGAYVTDSAPAVRDFEFNWYGDRDLTQLLETSQTPHREQMFTGSGSARSFAGTPEPTMLPIIPRTLFIDATIGAIAYRVFDNGVGGLVADHVLNGSVNYDTGAIAIEFINAPDDQTAINVGYFTRIDTPGY